MRQLLKGQSKNSCKNKIKTTDEKQPETACAFFSMLRELERPKNIDLKK